MNLSPKGFAFIKNQEGCKLKAYQDQVGLWTIGFGTTMYPDGRKVKKGDTITQQQADMFLQAQVTTVYGWVVDNSVKVKITQNMFDAMTSLAYNIGFGGFKSSTVLKKVNLKDFKGAADAFLSWVKGNGKVLPVLVQRRQKERALFLS